MAIFGGMKIATWLNKPKKPELSEMAADLGSVVRGTATGVYENAKEFNAYSYETKAIKSTTKGVAERLQRRGGGAVKHISTKFGGGKTHMLISLYYNVRERTKTTIVDPIVISGDELGPKDTLWHIIAKQTGYPHDPLDQGSPGEIRNALQKNGRAKLILIDEILHYLVKANGTSVGKSTLGELAVTFLRDLLKAVKDTEKTCMVITDPSNTLDWENKDTTTKELVSRFLSNLQSEIGRVAEPLRPTDDEDIPEIIRRKLFNIGSGFDRTPEITKIIEKYVEKCVEKGILPEEERENYRKQFQKSFPFTPDVITVLRDHWSSMKHFQLTRGLLRLLALVVHNLREENGKRYITLADFDLENKSIREEFVNSLENVDDAVLSSDVTGSDARAAIVEPDKKLARRCASVIFLYSHNLQGGMGATANEIKRAMLTHGCEPDETSYILGKLKDVLYYMYVEDKKYKFRTKPNLNHIIADEVGKVDEKNIKEKERHYIERNTEAVLWPKNPSDVKDKSELQYVILPEQDDDLMRRIINECSEQRQYRNAIIFICPSPSILSQISDRLRKIIAYDKILNRIDLNLDKEQKEDLKSRQSEVKKDIASNVMKKYSSVFAPVDKGNVEHVATISEYNPQLKIEENVEKLLVGSYIHKTIEPKLLLVEYGPLPIKTSPLYYNMMNTPGGRLRPVDVDVVKHCIDNGIGMGVFGVGYDKTGGDPQYHMENDQCMLTDNEYLMEYQPTQKEQTKAMPARGTPSLEPPHAVQNNIQEVSMLLNLPKLSNIQDVIGTLEKHRRDGIVTIRIDANVNMNQSAYDELVSECHQLDPEADVKTYR